MPIPQNHSSDNTNDSDIDHGNYMENAPDASTTLEEIVDFPSHFMELDGRLFSAGDFPYPLPVDTPEQERHTCYHNLLRWFFRANYIGPVLDVLSEGGTQRMVLDLCTGNGKWLMDMANEFPQVHFRGIDIAPIATRYPLEKVQFEIQDVNETYRWNVGTFDLVHARSISMAVKSFPDVLREVARVLRPGGLFVSYEWQHRLAFDPSLAQFDTTNYAPACARLYRVLNEVLGSTRGFGPEVTDPQVASWLTASGQFTEITPESHYVPIGGWKPDPILRSIGLEHIEAQKRYADSVKLLLLGSGMPEHEVETITNDFKHEIRVVQGLVMVLYTVHARRV